MNKHFIVAALICGALGTFYFVSREKQVRVGMRELSLNSFDRESVTRIEYSGRETFTLAKLGDGFVLQTVHSAKALSASKEAIAELFSAALGVKSGVFVTEQTSKHDEFKVNDRDGQRVTFFAQNEPVWDLIIGDDAQAGRYVRVPANDCVFLSKARFWDITRNHKNDFRERRIVGVEEGMIESVHVENGSGVQIGFIRDAKNNWGFDAKTSAAYPKVYVSSNRAADFVKMAVELRATSFIETQPMLERAMVALKASTDRLVVKPKDRPELVFIVAKDAIGKKVYAKSQGSDLVFEISDYIFGRLHPKPEDFKESL